MKGSKAYEDTFNMYVVNTGTSYHGLSQGFYPVYHIKRCSHIWEDFGGYYSPISIATETIQVRPKIIIKR